jgi:hypothetical protein
MRKTMTEVLEARKPGGVSDAAVQKATGRSWAEWLALLDAAGAEGLDHKEIVAQVAAIQPPTGGWWCQMIAVGYEQARGKRALHETATGFQVSASATVGVPLAKLYTAWVDEATRAHWLPDAPLAVRKATVEKTLRLAWNGGASRADVYFTARGPAKSQVTVQHVRLPDAEAGAAQQAYWRERLAALKRLLEGGR